MNRFKKLVIVATLGLLLLGTQHAAASISTTTNIGGWQAEAVKITDKTFTLVDSNLGTGSVLIFEELDSGLHRLTINSNFKNVNAPPGPYYLRYSVTIDPMMSPDTAFARVALNSDVGNAFGSPSTVTKGVYADSDFSVAIDTLVSTNGTPDTTGNFLGLELTTIWIHETFVHSQDNVLIGTTNVFTQGNTAVPEPASLAIWSLIAVGGAAAAASRRQRRGRWSSENRAAIRGIIERN